MGYQVQVRSLAYVSYLLRWKLSKSSDRRPRYFAPYAARLQSAVLLTTNHERVTESPRAHLPALRLLTVALGGAIGVRRALGLLRRRLSLAHRLVRL